MNYTLYISTEVPAYSDTLGTWEKCHCNQKDTVSRGSLVTNQLFGTCQKCHCKQGVNVNSVTVSGEICTKCDQGEGGEAKDPKNVADVICVCSLSGNSGRVVVRHTDYITGWMACQSYKLLACSLSEAVSPMPNLILI